VHLASYVLSPALLGGCLVVAVAMAGEQACDGPYKDRTLSPEELMTVLRNHQAWRASGERPNDSRRANLCRAILDGADLEGAELPRADLRQARLSEAKLQRALLFWANFQGATLGKVNLQGARLAEANLQGAKLTSANLQQANMWEADLQYANLEWANLQGATLGEVNLRGASLWKADLQRAFLGGAKLQKAFLRDVNLQEANLRWANLQGADLWEAKLQGAKLGGAILTNVIYDPNPESLPRIADLVETPTRLEGMIFARSPAALIALREAYKKAGLRTQERQLTYAIESTWRRKARDDSWPIPGGADTRPWLAQLWGELESGFKLVAFEWPSDYGMSYGRPLKILVVLIGVFSVIYMIAVFTARGRAGIWVTWPADRVYQEEGAKEATRVTNTFFFPRLQARVAGRWWGRLLRGVLIPLIGLYFSLLSAFSLGWRELNVGTWIARMQTREYVLRATGWVRTLAGIQSLLSVYLLALWALTYFGRPFE
jgi:uncharacterized protein YjbI with pentapeptide repeats